ncbi:MAG: hypothetical protein QOI41_4141 [Myxococcales bacterium]|nr:hypothetical protein [Myxococcales bacterium]
MYRQPAVRPKNHLPLLDRAAVSTPCKASWNDMEGDDRVRFCCSCSKNVYDLSAMTEDEAEGFLALHLDDQDTCVKLYRRPDGRILTSDCPRGAHTRHARRAAMAGVAAVCAATAIAGVVASAHVPRAHRLPRSTARFEVPRPPPASPMTQRPSTMADDEPRPQLTWGVEEVSMGALAIDPAATLLAREPPPASRIRLAEVTQTDGLPVPVVQRIVRQSFGRFRVAYERGLTKNPKLAGRVVVRFTIGRDGSVLESSDGGSSLPDADVVRDVVHALMALSFPAPDNDGSVVVTMPIDFARSS